MWGRRGGAIHMVTRCRGNQDAAPALPESSECGSKCKNASDVIHSVAAPFGSPAHAKKRSFRSRENSWQFTDCLFGSSRNRGSFGNAARGIEQGIESSSPA